LPVEKPILAVRWLAKDITWLSDFINTLNKAADGIGGGGASSAGSRKIPMTKEPNPNQIPNPNDQ